MGEKYSKLPSEILATSQGDFELNLAVYLYSNGESAHRQAYQQRVSELQQGKQ